MSAPHYREILEQMWSDGVLVEAEFLSLTQVQEALGIGHEEAAELEREVMGMTKAEALVAGLNAQASQPGPNGDSDPGPASSPMTPPHAASPEAPLAEPQARPRGAAAPAQPIPATRDEPDLTFSGGATVAPGTGPGASPADTPGDDPAADLDGSISGDRTLAGAGPGADPADQLHAGLRLGRDQRYELLDKVGEGGMGSVWRARDLNVDGRVVAMKRIRAFDAADRVMLQRFEQERGTIAGLNHANVVTVYDAGEDGLGPYLVMEFVEGAPLDELLRDDPPDEDHAVAIFEGLCRGVAHAHKKGVIHRDIKPSNVILDGDGTPKLLDFGLARGAVGLELSMTGYGMGTLDYSAPEQKRDAKSVDERADIYSLGATFYELLTGLKPVPLHIAKAPARWQGIVARCCEPSPEDRFASAADVLAGLKEARERSHAAAPAPHEDEDDLRCPAPSCRQMNALDARHCRACGEGLQVPCPACDEQHRVGLRHCDKCGASVDSVREAKARFEAAQLALEEGRLGVANREVEEGLGRLDGVRLGAAKDLPSTLKGIQADASSKKADASDSLARASAHRAAEEYEAALTRLREAAALDASHRPAVESETEELESLIPKRDAARAIDSARHAEREGLYPAAIEHYQNAVQLDATHRGVAEHEVQVIRKLNSVWGYRTPILNVVAAFIPSNHRKINEVLNGLDGASRRAKRMRFQLRARFTLTSALMLAASLYVSSRLLDAHSELERTTSLLQSSATFEALEEAMTTAQQLKTDRWTLLTAGSWSPPHPHAEQWDSLYEARRAELVSLETRRIQNAIRSADGSSILTELKNREQGNPTWPVVDREWNEKISDLAKAEVRTAQAAIDAARTFKDLENLPYFDSSGTPHSFPDGLLEADLISELLEDLKASRDTKRAALAAKAIKNGSLASVSIEELEVLASALSDPDRRDTADMLASRALELANDELVAADSLESLVAFEARWSHRVGWKQIAPTAEKRIRTERRRQVTECTSLRALWGLRSEWSASAMVESDTLDAWRSRNEVLLLLEYPDAVEEIDTASFEELRSVNGPKQRFARPEALQQRVLQRLGYYSFPDYCQLDLEGVRALRHRLESAYPSAFEGFRRTTISRYECGGITALIAVYTHERTGLRFSLIPGGTFSMGSDAAGLIEGPAHQRTVAPFLICQRECLSRAWAATAPLTSVTLGLPKAQVSWTEANNWCLRNDLELPSEAQWEYAARAGTTSPYAFGDQLDPAVDVVGLQGRSGGPGRPNALGLEHVHGNVWEWCRGRPYAYPGQEDPLALRFIRDAVSTGKRMLRGGSASTPPEDARVSSRAFEPSTLTSDTIGFRPCRSLTD